MLFNHSTSFCNLSFLYNSSSPRAASSVPKNTPQLSESDRAHSTTSSPKINSSLIAGTVIGLAVFTYAATSLAPIVSNYIFSNPNFSEL